MDSNGRDSGREPKPAVRTRRGWSGETRKRAFRSSRVAYRAVSAPCLGGKRGKRGGIVARHLFEALQVAAQGVRIHRRKPGKHPPRSVVLALQAQQNRLPENGTGNRGEAQRVGIQLKLRIHFLAVQRNQLGREEIIVAGEERSRAQVRGVLQLRFGDWFISLLRAVCLTVPALEISVIGEHHRQRSHARCEPEPECSLSKAAEAQGDEGLWRNAQRDSR